MRKKPHKHGLEIENSTKKDTSVLTEDVQFRAVSVGVEIATLFFVG